MQIVLDVPEEIGKKLEKIPKQVVTMTLQRLVNRQTPSPPQENSDDPFQALLAFKSLKPRRDSTKLIREERDKLDTRNQPIP